MYLRTARINFKCAFLSLLRVLKKEFKQSLIAEQNDEFQTMENF